MRSPDPYSGAKLGLIPALATGTPLRRSVQTIYDRFARNPLVADEVNLTNFGLHLHALPGGGTPAARLTPDGLVRLPIPDKPKERVYLFDQFCYEDNRELATFANALLVLVETFIGDLPTAFEEGTCAAMMRRGGAL